MDTIVNQTSDPSREPGVRGWRSFVEGTGAVSSLMLGVIPFGVVCGASCVEGGYSAWEAMGLSVVVFAGASQLMVIQMLQSGASLVAVVLAGAAVNLRMLMYSASLAPHMASEPKVSRLMLSYLLTDQAYAVSLARFSSGDQRELHRTAFFVGAGLGMWLCFNLATLIGALVGRWIPGAWELDFAVPLTFIALMVPHLRDRRRRAVAGVAALAACLLQGVPLHGGLLLGSCLGIACGWVSLLREQRGNRAPGSVAKLSPIAEGGLREGRVEL